MNYIGLKLPLSLKCLFDFLGYFKSLAWTFFRFDIDRSRQTVPVFRLRLSLPFRASFAGRPTPTLRERDRTASRIRPLPRARLLPGEPAATAADGLPGHAVGIPASGNPPPWLTLNLALVLLTSDVAGPRTPANVPGFGSTGSRQHAHSGPCP